MSRIQLVTPCAACGHKGDAHLSDDDSQMCVAAICTCDEDVSLARDGARVHRPRPDMGYEDWAWYALEYSCHLTVCPCAAYMAPGGAIGLVVVPEVLLERVDLTDPRVPNAVRSMVKGAEPHNWRVAACYHAQSGGHESVAVRLSAHRPGDLYRYAVATWWDGKFASAYWSTGRTGGRLKSAGLRAWLREGRTDGDGGRGAQ